MKNYFALLSDMEEVAYLSGLANKVYYMPVYFSLSSQFPPPYYSKVLKRRTGM